MTCNFFLLTLSISVLFIYTFSFKEDEWYCNVRKNFKICLHCDDLDEECIGLNECKCAHIQIKNIDEDFQGECTTTNDYGLPFCYVDEDSTCADKEESSLAKANDDIWYPSSKKLYTSIEACQDMNDKSEVGSEEILKNVRIIDDLLLSDDDISEAISLTFSGDEYKSWLSSEKSTRYKIWYAKWKNNTFDDDHETNRIDIDEGDGFPFYKLCEFQCETRNDERGTCGAWSFDTVNRICHLHNNGACCGQREKQQNNDSFISGYKCPHCWSTYGKCPCDDATLELSNIKETGHSNSSKDGKRGHPKGKRGFREGK